MHCAVYLRQSQDKANDERAVSRQREDCLKLCEARGWTPVEYLDNDISASKGVRPAYQRMLADIHDGKIQAVVAWHLDRLHRRPVELEHFIALADEKRLALATVTGDVDLSTDNGRLIARITGAVARAEVERKSARQKRAALQRAEEGRAHSGGRRAFGYEADKKTVDEEEAALVRSAYNAVMDGEGLSTITRRWNGAGITTTTGGRWHSVTLRHVLLNPRHAGLRSYQGEILKGVDTEGVKCTEWDAIVDEDIWRAVHGILTQPSRRNNFTTGRKYLLTGIAVCGICDAPMSSNIKRGYTIYACKQCYGCSRRQDAVDRLVIDLVLGFLARPDAAELLVDQHAEGLDALRRRERALMDRLDELALDRADGILDRRAYQVARERVESRLAEVTEKMRGGDRHRLLEDLVRARNPRKVWESKSLDKQRAIIRTLMRPRILPAGRGRQFTHDQLVPGWLTGEE